MTALAPYLAAFLREHLPGERRASRHTCEAYATTFQLLVTFAAHRLAVRPSGIVVEQLDAPLVLAFLEHLEQERGNTPRSRNARLAAINSFFRYLEFRLPACLDQARQIGSIPIKKTDQALVAYLTREEVQAVLAAPDPRSRAGTRDRAMLYLTFAGGLRVSELLALRLDRVRCVDQPSVHVVGKGRRERELPLWKETAATITAWIAIRPPTSAPVLFLNATGRPMTRSGFEYILAKHVAVAATTCPTLAEKRVTPHVLRHTCAMHILQATRDVRQVSLWLGHASLQSTEVYLRADPTEKLATLAASDSPPLAPGRFTAPDKLLAMLKDMSRPDYAE